MWVTQCQSIKLKRAWGSRRIPFRKDNGEDTDLLKPSDGTFGSHIPSTPDKWQFPTDVQSFPSLKLREILFSFFLLTLPFKCSSTWPYSFMDWSLFKKELYTLGGSVPMLPRKLIIQCFRDVCHFDINHSFHLKFVFQKKDSAKKYRLKSKSRGFFPN